MASSKTGTGSRRGIPPASLLLLALVLVPVTAHADDLRLCPPGTYPMTEAAVRLCDADQAQLPHVLVELRVAEQRLALAAGDALVLGHALRAESALVVDLRRELRAASAWGPRWAWLLVGGALGVAGSVVLALAL